MLSQVPKLSAFFFPVSPPRQAVCPRPPFCHLSFLTRVSFAPARGCWSDERLGPVPWDLRGDVRGDAHAGRVPSPPSFPGEFLSTTGSSCSGRCHALSSLTQSCPSGNLLAVAAVPEPARLPPLPPYLHPAGSPTAGPPGHRCVGTRSSTYFGPRIPPACPAAPQVHEEPWALINSGHTWQKCHFAPYGAGAVLKLGSHTRGKAEMTLQRPGCPGQL